MISMEARRPKILSRLIDRFGLKPGKVSSFFRLGMEIMPVTVVDEVLKEPKVGESDVDHSSSFAICFTVPKKEKWYIKAFGKDATVGASRLYIDGDGVAFFLMAAVVEATIIFPGVAIVLTEGMMIKIGVGAGGDTSTLVQILYEMEQL